MLFPLMASPSAASKTDAMEKFLFLPAISALQIIT
jgi:hypothetical protein